MYHTIHSIHDNMCLNTHSHMNAIHICDMRGGPIRMYRWSNARDRTSPAFERARELAQSIKAGSGNRSHNRHLTIQHFHPSCRTQKELPPLHAVIVEPPSFACASCAWTFLKPERQSASCTVDRGLLLTKDRHSPRRIFASLSRCLSWINLFVVDSLEDQRPARVCVCVLRVLFNCAFLFARAESHLPNQCD